MSTSESQRRRRFAAQEKVAILRQHLIEKVPVSDVCDRHGLNPTQFYRWQKALFENAAAAFDARPARGDRARRDLQERLGKLQARLARKDEVIAELLEEHVRLKKTLGDP